MPTKSGLTAIWASSPSWMYDAVGDRRDVLEHVRGVAVAEQRAEEDAVREPVGAAGGVDVRGVVRGGLGRMQVERDAELLVRAGLGAHGVDRQAVAEHQVVGGAQRGLAVLDPGRVHADGVAEERGHPRLVERRPVLDAVVQAGVDGGRVLGEVLRGVALRPAALVLEHLREVPVVERDPGLMPWESSSSTSRE